MESSKSSSTVRHVGVPLSNFSANIKELDVGEGFFLTTLSGEEEELLSNAKSLVGPFVGLSPFERFTAVLKSSYNKTGSEPDETSSEHISRATAAITALRLVKSGPVGSPGIIVRGRLGGGSMVLFTPVDEWRVPGVERTRSRQQKRRSFSPCWRMLGNRRARKKAPALIRGCVDSTSRTPERALKTGLSI